MLRVRVQPRASRDAVWIEPDNRVRVALTSPPVDNAANNALCAFMAKRLGIAKSKVALIGGGKAREKTVRVSGLDSAEVFERLSAGGSRKRGKKGL